MTSIDDDDANITRGAWQPAAPSRLRANAYSHSNQKQQDNDRQQQGPSPARQMPRMRSRHGTGLSTIGWTAVGGLAMLGLFLLLSSRALKSDYTNSHSNRLWSSTTSNTAKASLDELLANCLASSTHRLACKVEHADRLASHLVQRQSRTPQQAVLEYKRRYLRAPPRAFEAWVKLALEHNATIIDDYDQIHVDLSTFRQANLVGDRLKSRILEAKSKMPEETMGQLSIVDGHAVVFGTDLGPMSASTLVEMLKPVQHIIPDVTILFNWLAEPRVPHSSARSSSEPLDSPNLSGKSPVKVLADACPSNHLTPQRSWDSLQPPLDVCQEDMDELSDLHGFLQAPDNFRPINKLIPLVSRSKLSNFADILAPNICYGHRDYRGVPDTIPWDQKHNSLYWRGTTTGEAQTATTWARGHRHRMLRYVKQLREAANKLINGVEVDPFDKLYAPDRTIATSHQSVRVAGNTLPLFDYTDNSVVGAIKRLGSQTFNVAWNQFVLADDATLASLKTIHVTTGTEPHNEAYKHKFALDLDGQSMSCRFYQMLASNSVVIKQTIWAEYHDDRLIPWIHYVPLDLRVQNNELPMLLDFFINHPEGPATASKIAAASKQWADTTLRPIDLALYYARLLIEFAELYNPAS